MFEMECGRRRRGLAVLSVLAVLSSGTAPGAPEDFAEAAKTWRLLARDIRMKDVRTPDPRKTGLKPTYQPPAAECEHPAARILPEDRDPLDVLLRRTHALAEDLHADMSALKALAARAEQTTNADERFSLAVETLAVRRKIAFANPLLKDIRKLLFIGREALPPNEFYWGTHMCDQFFGFHATLKYGTHGNGLYVLEEPFSDHPVCRNLLADAKVASGPPEWVGKTLWVDHRAKAGACLSPDVSWDGERIAFSWTPGLYALRHWDDRTCFHVCTCRADGSDLRIVTYDKYNDLFPCWLPNGRLVFCSERRGGYGRCHFRKCPNFTLFSMFPDGTDITCLSPHETNEFEPSVDNNGMIVYTRWDYVDRGFNQAHHAWIAYPDGRDPREFNGNTREHQGIGPHFEHSIRAIPGSRRYVMTACGHHTLARGSLILVDPTVPDDDRMSAIRRLTPDQLFPESEYVVWDNRHSGAYATAWPLSEKYFLCVYDGDANGQYGQIDTQRRKYAITLLDVFGNKIRLFEHPEISCFDPMPLGARPMPPVLTHRMLKGRPVGPDGKRPAPLADAVIPKTAEVACVNVYNSRYPYPKEADGTPVRATALRIWQILPKTEPLDGHPRLGAIDQTPGRQCLGTVPVEADGSCRFMMPVGVPFYMQTLDAAGCAIQTMRSATYVQPGERLTCNGCHEHRNGAARNATQDRLPLAMRREPSAIAKGPYGSRPWNYPRLVQPVLDTKCIACHAPTSAKFNAAKMPDLTKGDLNRNPYNFHTSFVELTERGLYQYYTKAYKGPDWWKVPIQGDDFVSPHSTPGKVGARASRLYAVLKGGHHGVKLSPDDWSRLILFMDAQGAYIAHDHNAREQCDGKVVEPALE